MGRSISWLIAAVGSASAVMALPAAAQAAVACPTAMQFEHRDGELGLGRIVAPGRTRLQSDTAGCPSDKPQCLMKPYLVAGDQVVTGPRRGDWVCVLYPNDKGGAEGWVKAAQVSQLTPPVAPASAWAGEWRRDEDASIKLEARGAEVVVSGNAQWVGSIPGQVNVGELSGRARPSGVGLTIGGADQYDCRASLRLLGPYLVVTDNMMCGGVNVSFTGAYRRAR